MTSTVNILEVLPAGSRVIATGNFISGQQTDLLIGLANGTYGISPISPSGAATITPVTLPAGYTPLNAGTFNVTAPGTNQLLLRNAAGNLVYGTYNAPTQSFVATNIGNPGTNWSAVAIGDFNSWYNGTSQVLLESAKNGTQTAWAFGSQLPQFTVPAGFTIVPGGTGNFFGSDLPGVLVVNAGGTLEAMMNGEVTNGGQVATAVATLGTLHPGDTVVGVADNAGAGTADILIQNSGTLSEWIVREGVVTQTISIGAMPTSASVVGFTAINGSGAPGVLLLNAGSVEVVTGAETPLAIGALAHVGAAEAAIILDGSYAQTTNTGVNSTLSDYLAELLSGNLKAAGVTILKVQQGAISHCSFEQVAAGNETLAAWEQSVATLDQIAALCRQQGISVQVELQLGLNLSWGLAQTMQWLTPAVAAGLPIASVEDDGEPNYQAMSAATMAATAANVLTNIAAIHAAYSSAQFGQWFVMGNYTGSATPTPYLASVKSWLTTINQAAAKAGLPGISYAVTDQYYSPVLNAATGAVSIAGTAPGQNTILNAYTSFAAVAQSAGVAVEMAAEASDADLNPLQVLARQALQVSQEASANTAGIMLDAAFNVLPASGGVNTPGSAQNASAEIAAVEPLYSAHGITTKGSMALGLPPQFVVQGGSATTLGGLTLSAGAADVSNRLAVVLIDQTGTLSASQVAGATVSSDGANILILTGTPGAVAAELATVKLQENALGPDAIDVQVYGNTGIVGSGVINILATNSASGGSFLPSPAGALAQQWLTASAQVNNGKILNETLTYNTSDGLSSSEFIGGATIQPITQDTVFQPLLQAGLVVTNGAAALPASVLQAASGWQVFDPLSGTSPSTTEEVPVTISGSTLTFNPTTGIKEQQVDTIAPVPASAISGLFPYSNPNQPYYFANGGSIVTDYNVANSPYWSTAIYDNGAGGMVPIVNGNALTVAYGSTSDLAVGSIETVYGVVNGQSRVVEVRYLGGASAPYDEVDQVFNPYSATPQLWQQIQTVALPASMAGSAPLPVSSATTVINFNTGNNPNWSNTIETTVNGIVQPVSVAGDRAAATTYESGNWDSQAQVAADGTVTVQRGVTWIDQGQILAAYTLATPTITSWSSGTSLTVSGTGIAGDWVDLTGSNGTAAATLGGAQVGANGTWSITTTSGLVMSAGYSVRAQQYDLAGDSSVQTAPMTAPMTAPITVSAVVAVNGATFSAPAGSSVTVTARNVLINGSQLTITTQGTNPSLTVSGTNNTIDAAAGSTVNFTAVRPSGGSSFTGVGGSVTVTGAGSATVTGNQVTVRDSTSGNTLSFSGNNTMLYGGAGQTITLNGTYQEVEAGSGSTIVIHGQNSGIIASGVTISAPSAGTTFWVQGTSDTVNLAAGDLLNVHAAQTIGFISGSSALKVTTSGATSQTVSGFSVATGDEINLSHLITAAEVKGGSLSDYIGVASNAGGTVLAIQSPQGSDTITLAGVSGLNLQQLINAHALVLPN